ncbi:MAG TPA: MBL fold metallo-hydrolase [Acidimicrobiia bacterium]|nr:MBL fold metallo-hydrolase [Acidimicrobiia bacterium]
MKLQVVGSSGTFPVPGRPASGYVIEQSGTRVWCDAGPGTFVSLPVDSYLIDAVVISHQHPDHCSDVFTAFHAWTYCREPRTAVPLYAPQAVWDQVSGFLDGGQGSRLRETFDFRPVWTGDEVEIGDLAVSFTEMDHSVPTVGSRWEAENRSLFFTADTGPKGNWREMARGVDLMLSESAYQERGEDDYPHHLTSAEAGRIAREVQARRLVLTHIPPYLDVSRSVSEAETAFDKPVSVAVPGASFDV